MVTHVVSGESAHIVRFDGDYVYVEFDCGRVECWGEEYCIGLDR